MIHDLSCRNPTFFFIKICSYKLKIGYFILCLDTLPNQLTDKVIPHKKKKLLAYLDNMEYKHIFDIYTLASN